MQFPIGVNEISEIWRVKIASITDAMTSTLCWGLVGSQWSWGKGSNPDDAYNFFSVNFFLEKTENKTKNETEIDHLKNHSCLFFGENPL